MAPMHIEDDTIAAISTPIGEGGIGIVRLSGPAAIAIANRMFMSARGKSLADQPRGIYYGAIEDDGVVLDEVLVSLMPAPHSYTCEDVVEINGHGGTGPLNAILDLALRNGARLAGPGEFTKRAFLNGRLDLVQAEAVIDRIQARTRAGLAAAHAAADGVLSREVYAIAEALQEAQALLEAAVDFPEDDLPELVDEGFRRNLSRIRDHMRRLLDTADAGRLYREGVAVAIVGRPNAGKSSLFNALLQDARALVTPVPGTTRDLIEETITIQGVPVRLSDTAGLRQAENEVEQLGIAVARKAAENASVLLYVVDVADVLSEEEAYLAEEVLSLQIPCVVALNKIDQAQAPATPDWATRAHAVCLVSAVTEEGLHELEEALGKLLLGEHAVAPDQSMLTRTHQRDSMRRACEAIEGLLEHLDASPEFLSIDLAEAISALGEITGETTPDDILERIFSAFCIGK